MCCACVLYLPLLYMCCASCSDSALGPPASEDDLQVAYEAALWQLLGFCFLEYDDLDRGAFPEVGAGDGGCGHRTGPCRTLPPFCVQVANDTGSSRVGSLPSTTCCYMLFWRVF